MLFWRCSSYNHLPTLRRDVYKGRPSTRQRHDWYDVLGVQPNATPEAIKKAYRLRAKTTHPDLTQGTTTLQDFLLLKEAYNVLIDVESRSNFDRQRTVAAAADIGFRVTEILAADLAVPLARDVALPLIKATFNTLNTKVIRGFAGPFIAKAVARSMTVIDSFKAAMANRTALAEVAESTKRLEEAMHMQVQVQQLQRQAAEMREKTTGAAHAFETMEGSERRTLGLLQTEMAAAEHMKAEERRLGEERVLAEAELHRGMMEHGQVRGRVQLEKVEVERAAVCHESAEQVLLAAESELEEAQEAMKQAQMRLVEAQKGYQMAMRLFGLARETHLEARTRFDQVAKELSSAEKVVSLQRQRMDDLEQQEQTLRARNRQHLETQKALQAELRETVRARRRAKREYLKQEEERRSVNRRLVNLAQQMDKAYQKQQQIAARQQLQPEQLQQIGQPHEPAPSFVRLQVASSSSSSSSSSSGSSPQGAGAAVPA